MTKMKKTYIAPSTDIELTAISQLLCESADLFDGDTDAVPTPDPMGDAEIKMDWAEE